MSKTFTYGAIHRPVSGIGHAPAGFIAFGDHPDFKFGTVSYEHPLSREQQEHYSLVDLSRSNAEIAEEIARDMSEYAAEYVEEAETDSRHFEAAVGQRLDRMNVHAKRHVVAPIVLRLLKGESSSVESTPVAVASAPSRKLSRQPRASRARKVVTPSYTFKTPVGVDKDWIKVNSDLAVLGATGPAQGDLWQVSAARDGGWRVRQPPLRYQDDPRAYAEGNVDVDDVMSSKERFAAAKKMARKFIGDLIKKLAEEERG